MRRIIIHGLRSEYRNIVVTVQGWKIQPSLVEFDNMLAGQESMAKKMGGVSQKGEEEALYIIESRENSTMQNVAWTKRNDDKEKIIRERRIIVQGEFQRTIVAKVRCLKGSVIAAERRDIKTRFVASTKSLLRATMQQLLVQRKRVKIVWMLKHFFALE